MILVTMGSSSEKVSFLLLLAAADHLSYFMIWECDWESSCDPSP